jgi:hypothetical protein
MVDRRSWSGTRFSHYLGHRSSNTDILALIYGTIMGFYSKIYDIYSILSLVGNCDVVMKGADHCKGLSRSVAWGNTPNRTLSITFLQRTRAME